MKSRTLLSVKALWIHLQWTPCSKSKIGTLTLVLLWFKKKKTHKKRSSSFSIHWIFVEFVSIWQHAVQLFLLRSCLSFEIGCHTFSVNTIACSTVPCMILVPIFFMTDYDVALYCALLVHENKTSSFPPLPQSFTLIFLVRESELLQKHHERVQMGTVSNSLSLELFYIYMKDQFWMVFEYEGERLAVISLHPFFLTFMNLSYIFFLMLDFICSFAIVCI